MTHILSYDEKPGIQAIANAADDLMPNESSGVIKRDYEYKRLETVSLLAGIDAIISEHAILLIIIGKALVFLVCCKQTL